jgi:hypothetical protein
MNATRYATAAAANAAIVAMGGEPSRTHYAAGHIDLTTRETYFLVFNGSTIEAAAPVRSERFVYTPSGKKRTSRELCGRVYRKYSNDRKAFIAAAVELGVRPATANVMFSHYSVGRYAA